MLLLMPINFEKTVLIAISWLLSCLEILIFARVILSFAMVIFKKEWKIGNVIFFLTEPILAPVRKLLSRFEALNNLPIDFSVLIVWMLIGFLQNAIRV